MVESSSLSDNIRNDGGRALLGEDIKPGDEIGYETAKQIFEYHPLGGKLAEQPITMAMGQEREYSIPGGPEEDLIKRFKEAREEIAADQSIHMTATLSRVYGISSLVVGSEGVPTNEPLTIEAIRSNDIYFNAADPLNTAGSLVLNQDAGAADFLKPRSVSVGGKVYHKSRSVILMNEMPIFLSFQASAFGFSGRSVYQRCLYPLKSYLEYMIAIDMIAQKCGLLVAKTQQNTSAANELMARSMGMKRSDLKMGKTGNVLSIGQEDSIETLDLQNLHASLTAGLTENREAIAAGAGMPAQLVNQQTFATGFGEGTEDAKSIAGFIESIREWMKPLYDLTDKVAMARAWDEDFYKTIQTSYPELYANIPYERAYRDWCAAFTPTWPSLLREPESKKVDVDKVRFEAVMSAFGQLLPVVDPENKAKVITWFQDCLNNAPDLIPAELDLDMDALTDFLLKQQENVDMGMGGGMGEDEGSDPDALTRSERVPMHLGG